MRRKETSRGGGRTSSTHLRPKRPRPRDLTDRWLWDFPAAKVSRQMLVSSSHFPHVALLFKPCFKVKWQYQWRASIFVRRQRRVEGQLSAGRLKRKTRQLDGICWRYAGFSISFMHAGSASRHHGIFRGKEARDWRWRPPFLTITQADFSFSDFRPRSYTTIQPHAQVMRSTLDI